MTQFTRTSMIGAFLVASLTAPLAFAQESATETQQAPPTAQAANADDATVAQPTAAADVGASTTASTEKKSWSDVDMDKDGALTKAEAGAVPALNTVFDKADANADGSLTAEEYKAYVAASKGGETGDKGKGGAGN